MKKSDVQILALIPDTQAPQQDDRAIGIALKLLKDIKPHILVYLGDVIAADSVGDFSKKTWREASLTLKLEAESANEVLDRFDITVGDIKKYYLEGNHERRILKWAIKNTAPLGEIDGLRIENLLRLKERNIKYIMLENQPLSINKFHLIHGYFINQYHAAKTVLKTQRNIFYGHTHDWQVHCSSHFGDDPAHIAMSCGCLCDFSQDYIQGRPTNWFHGITVIYYDKKGFTPYFIPIVKYRAIWNGRVYE